MAIAPVLNDQEIEYLLSVEKLVHPVDWKEQLLPPVADKLDLRARLDLDDLPASAPVRGRLHLYSRRNIHPAVEGDWSVGLIYTDYADRSYRVIRCNGPHPDDHTNVIEGTTIVRAPHIHRLTERYQRLPKPRPDGFAEPTSAYSTMGQALSHLASAANLNAAGRLFL